jgi:fucose 4-O-acetylase-like acetyltransferase
MTANRVAWIDTARGLGIVLVVTGHVWRGAEGAHLVVSPALYTSIDNAIYIFHMPLFFFLSGLFFERSVVRDGVATSFKKRIISLIYPLVLWSYITAVFLLAAGSLTNRDQISLSTALTFPFPPKDIFWFLGALFIIQTLASPIARGSKLIYTLCFVFLSVSLYAFDLSYLNDFSAKTLEMSPFFLLGMLFAGIDMSGRLAGLVGLLVFVAVEIWALMLHDHISSPGDFGFSVAGVLGLSFFACWVISECNWKVFQPLQMVGRASMGIYVCHVLVLAAVRIVLLKLGVRELSVQMVAGTFLGVAVPYFLYEVARRFGMLRILGLGQDSKQASVGRIVELSTAKQ